MAVLNGFEDSLIDWEHAEAYYHAQELAEAAERERLGLIYEMADEI